jgi:translation elongation factor EF-G
MAKMNYLNKWYEDILTRSSLPLAQSVRVRGQRDEHLGPREEFGEIEVLIEPSSSFEVLVDTKIEKSEEVGSFIDSALYGLLDVLLVSGPFPVRDVRILLTDLKYDAVRSSRMAFRQAGRDAGRRAVAMIANA